MIDTFEPQLRHSHQLNFPANVKARFGAQCVYPFEALGCIFKKLKPFATGNKSNCAVETHDEVVGCEVVAKTTCALERYEFTTPCHLIKLPLNHGEPKMRI